MKSSFSLLCAACVLASAATAQSWAWDDGTVPFGRSKEMIDAINGKGGMPAPKFTQLMGVGHFAWVPAYSDPGLLPWMFVTSRR